MTTVFKVVKPCGNAWKSCLATSTGLCLMYRVGKATKPTVGKLFAFSNYTDAQRFSDCYSGTKIFEAEAVVSIARRTTILNILTTSLLEVIRMWKGEALGSHALPTGTVLCDQITLITEA